MHAFLITGKKESAAKEKAYEIAKDKGVGKPDITIIEFEKALGIEDIRRLNEKIFLKPNSGSKKIITLDLHNGATLEAQNAMLKVLEEPPQSTVLIILAENKNQFLSTVLSRCFQIEIKNKEKSNPITEEDLEKLINSTLGEKFYLAHTLSEDNEKALAWLENSILILRESLLEKKDTKELKKASRLIKELLEVHFLLRNTNVNVRLALENLFIRITL